MRKTMKQDFLDKAYEYIEESGPVTARKLLEHMWIRPSTGRVNAELPKIRAAVQYLRMDKRFKGEKKLVSRSVGVGVYYMMVWSLVGDEE